MAMHSGNTWRILQNLPCSAAMRPYVTLTTCFLGTWYNSAFISPSMFRPFITVFGRRYRASLTKLRDVLFIIIILYYAIRQPSITKNIQTFTMLHRPKVSQHKHKNIKTHKVANILHTKKITVSANADQIFCLITHSERLHRSMSYLLETATNSLLFSIDIVRNTILSRPTFFTNLSHHRLPSGFRTDSTALWLVRFFWASRFLFLFFLH